VSEDLTSLHFASHPFAAQPQRRFTTLSHPESYELNAERPCAPRPTKAPSFLDKIPFLNTNSLALAHSHLATLPCNMVCLSHCLLPQEPSLTSTASMPSSPKPVFLHSTPGIFFGSNTTRTSLDRATAFDARQSVSEVCLPGGCRFLWAAHCLQARGLNSQVASFIGR